MPLKSNGGLVFTITTIIAFALCGTNIGLLSSLEEPDETTIRLKIITIFNMVNIMTIMIMAYYGEDIIDKKFNTGIKLEIVGFILTILNFVFSIIMIIFIILIKNKSQEFMVPIFILSISLVLLNIIIFMSYVFAVEEEEFF
jgi:uncharacterized membrane protein